MALVADAVDRDLLGQCLRFALFIVTYYGGAVALGTPEEWNESLPRLYVAGGTGANAMIGLHFAFGALLLLAGPIQLMSSVRARWPRVHRWIGWTYAPAALLTGLGGCLYILARGTVGGWPMTIGFFLYGALVVLSAVQTLRHALARDFETHRAWAIRLFALAIGSWLYRMDYGLMFAVFGRAGHTDDFSGWFDHVMDFWFYVPNLIVAELAIRGQRAPRRPWPAVGWRRRLSGGEPAHRHRHLFLHRQAMGAGDPLAAGLHCLGNGGLALTTPDSMLFMRQCDSPASRQRARGAACEDGLDPGRRGERRLCRGRRHDDDKGGA